MKLLNLLFCLFLFSSCSAQESDLLIRQDLISDWSKYPIYPRLVDDTNNPTGYKEEFTYLDDIDVYRIT
jgi:hypothetical protein